MLCGNCQRLTAMRWRTLCSICYSARQMELRREKAQPEPRRPYDPEDHIGKRERLRRMIQAAREAGEL